MYLADATLRHLKDVVSEPDLTGTRYTLVREVGRGGMGTVFVVRDAVLDREVALKVVNTAGAHAVLDGRLRDEARVLARLEHPGIVPVHDAGTLADGRAFYVMSLVKGESLDAHLARLDRIEERLRLFERICEPVAFAHAHGVVHRDLKPGNVMIGAFGEVLVLDWGLSVPVGIADDSHRAGTPGFIAPEAGPDRPADPRLDVFALGAMLLLLLAGGLPAAGRVDATLRARRIPRRLRAICAKATAAEAGSRYDDAQALADDVRHFLAGRPVAAYREGPLDRIARFAWTYRTPILIVLAYLVMRTIVAVYMAGGGR